MNRQSAVREPQSPLTDSPWFWVMVFSAMALAALLAIGPKYGGRQARLERQYQARQRIAAERAASSADAAPNDQQAPHREFASAEETLIPLWPLAALLSGMVTLAAIMLIRGRGRPGSPRRRLPGSLERHTTLL
jgi:hypothetical protein